MTLQGKDHPFLTHMSPSPPSPLPREGGLEQDEPAGSDYRCPMIRPLRRL